MGIEIDGVLHPYYNTTGTETTIHEPYSYASYQRDMARITANLEDINYDYICGIAKGGLIPAVHLCHITNTPLLSFNDDGIQLMQDRLTKILMVDDIIDSGKTATRIERQFERRFDWACLIWNAEQEVIPVAYGTRIERSAQPNWYDFWWEQHVPIVSQTYGD